MNVLKLLSVSPAKILKGSLDFSIRYTLADEILQENLRKRNWVVPVTAVKHAGGFLLVEGFRRWTAVREMNWDQIPLLVLDENLTEKELFLLSLALQCSTSITDLDRAIAVKRAKDRFGLNEKEIFEWVMSCLRLPCSSKVLLDYYRVGGLDGSVLELIHREVISFRVAQELGALKPTERQAFVDKLFPVCSFSQSEFLTVLESLKDLALKGYETMDAVLEREEIRDILNPRGWDLRERTKGLIRLIHRLRFPYLSEWERRFDEVSDPLKSGGEITVEKPPYFEGEGFHLTLKVRSYEHLLTILEDLERKKGLLKEIF